MIGNFPAWIPIVAVGILFLLWLRRWLTEPMKHRPVSPDLFRRILYQLLYQGYEGAFVRVESEQPEAFVQFRKAFHPNADPTLLFDFPDADWSRPYFRRVAEFAKGAGLNPVVVPTQDEETDRIMEVDFGGDVERAIDFSFDVLRDILGVDDAPSQCCAIIYGTDPRRKVRVGFMEGDSPKTQLSGKATADAPSNRQM